MRPINLILLGLIFICATACGQPKSDENAKTRVVKLEAKSQTQRKQEKTPSQTAKKSNSKTDASANEGNDKRAAMKSAPQPKETSSQKKESEKKNQSSTPSSPNVGSQAGARAASDDVTLTDVQKKTREAIMTIEAYVASKERVYHQKIDAQFARFDKRLEQLRVNAKKMSDEAKKRVSHEVKQLRGNLENTQENLLGKLEVSNEQDVKQLEQNLNTLVAEMEQSLQKVKP